MSAGTFDDRYLTWLYGQVAVVKTRKSSKTYWNLFRQLYSTEFVWLIPNDDNRAADGIQLRYEWAGETHTKVDVEWFNLGCSFLEMLIALSRRLGFETDEDSGEWFWHLLDNLELLDFNDRSSHSAEEVQTIVKTVILRKYERNGRGGLFPLKTPTKDQRKVEIWYQLSEYLLQI
jgi:hypothetical protein